MNKKKCAIDFALLRKKLCLFVVFLMCAMTVVAQGRIVTGTVVDDLGEVLPGVNVMIKGTFTGMSTGVDGKYSVTVSDRNAVLVFSSIGFVPQEVIVGDRAVINIKMAEDITSLDEVVVVAYGTQKKVTLTGAVAAIGTEDLIKAPVPNLGNALQGQLPGLTTIQYSGQPGADDPTIYIRGAGSLDASQSTPLFMVDGVERSFFRLDPNEIESVSILKDASATAVYGMRGANGVILVTTKRGQVGKARISVSTSAGIQAPIRLFEYADSYDYAMMYNEALRNDGTKEEDLPFKQHVLDAFRTKSDPLLYPNTDWMDMFMKSAAFQSQHNVNISGGTEQVRYFISLGALTQDGIYKSFDTSYNANWTYNRYNYRANLDIDVTKTTLLKVNLGGRLEQRHEPNHKSEPNSFFVQLNWGLPFAGVGLYDGKWVRGHSENIPIADGSLENGDVFEGIYGRGYIDRGVNTASLDVSLTQKLDIITKGLTFTVKGSYDNAFTHQKTRSKTEPYYTAHRGEDGALFFRKRREGTNFGFAEELSRSRSWALEAGLNYARSFGHHNFTALALYTQDINPYPGGTYSGIPRGYVGYVGRVTYDYASKYMIDFNLGSRGSENFPKGKRYGIFPAMSAGWNISEEAFMKDVPWINQLKIRASYGIVGFDAFSGGRFYYLPDAYNPSSGGYNFGTNVSSNQPAAIELRLGNRNVTWETERKQNYGLDFSMLNSRLSGTVEFFYDKRGDILSSRNTIPGYIAVSMPVINIGKTQRHGIEASLKWSQRINDFRYSFGGNVAFVKSKIVYKDEIPRKYDWRYETGRPQGQHFGYTFVGFATEADIASGNLPDHKIELMPGDALYKDLNEDGVIDDDDISAIGYTARPQLTGGFNMDFQYKKFDFSMRWAGSARVSRFVSSTLRIPFETTRNRCVLQYMVDDHWTPETAETAKTPILSFGHVDNNYVRNSTLWLKDASYLRLKNMQVGYSFSGDWLKKVGMSSLRVYVTGENLLTFDHLKISDPESTDGSRLDYPLTKIMNLGININF